MDSYRWQLWESLAWNLRIINHTNCTPFMSK